MSLISLFETRAATVFCPFILQSDKAVAVISPPGRGQPEASESYPTVKKTAMAELFGELFKLQVGNKPTLQLVKEEVTSYKAVDCISPDSNPLVWWRNNEPMYSHIAQLALRAVPATSDPSERVFSTAGDIVTASRSALSADNMDKLNETMSGTNRNWTFNAAL